MNLAFIPLYIKYLGMEAYGLIAIYAVLQASLAIVDAGMSATLGREMSRFTGGAHSRESIRDLLRSIEITGTTIAILYTVIIWFGSEWLATNWLKVEKIPLNEVAQAFSIMGIISGLRLLEGLFRGAIIGLQKQVLFNLVNVTIATLRSFGAVAILAFFSPTVFAYFIWQALVSALTLLCFVRIVYRSLPRGRRYGRFSKQEILRAGPFAAGILATTSLALLLTHLDKLILSKVLSLEEFGRYNLAATIATSLLILIYPITQAHYPRLIEIFSSGDNNSARLVFHRGSQLVTIISGASAGVIFAYGERLLALWTGNISLGMTAGPILKVLTLGTMLNCLTNMPFLIPLAAGNSGLNAKVNLIAVLFLAPANILITPVWGATGAAWVWVVLNLGYLLIATHFMFKMVLHTEKLAWFRDDVLKPLTGALATIAVFWFLTPAFSNTASEIVFIATAGITAMATSSIMAPEIHPYLAKLRAILKGNRPA